MSLQPAALLEGAALGVVLPLVATAWPVWRAVRVTPVDAIATTHRSGRSGLAVLLRRLPVPRSAFRRMPVGSVLRTPRRTLLTALGIGAAIATLVAILGMIDSFMRTMDRGERELLQHHPDRLVADLDRFVAEDGPGVASVLATAEAGSVEPVLQVGATGADVELLIEIVDMGSEVWTPTITAGSSTGLVIAEKAAADLGVGVGDAVLLEHPARRDGAVVTVETRVSVTGIHPGPFRFNAYLDRAHLGLFGAAGLANRLYVVPAAGASLDVVISGSTAITAASLGIVAVTLAPPAHDPPHAPHGHPRHPARRRVTR